MGYDCTYKTTVPKLADVDFMKCRHLYEIVSPRTGVCYMVWVEEYEEDFYAIKFHLRKDKKNRNKYSVLTGLNEARPIIVSCLKLLVRIANQNPRSSFGFIGAEMESDSGLANTKRYQVYKRFTSTFISEEQFEHHFLHKKSTYLLIRKSVKAERPDLLEVLYQKFSAIYPQFE